MSNHRRTNFSSEINRGGGRTSEMPASPLQDVYADSAIFSLSDVSGYSGFSGGYSAETFLPNNEYERSDNNKHELISRDGHSGISRDSNRSRMTYTDTLYTGMQQHDSGRTDSGFGSLRSERLSSDLGLAALPVSLDYSGHSHSGHGGNHSLESIGESNAPELTSVADRMSGLRLSDYERTNAPEQPFYAYEDDVTIGGPFHQDDDGDTPLHLAIIQMMHALALHLIAAATDIVYLNLPNNLYQTPLHLAVITQQPKIVRRLILAGAAIDIRDRKGNTAMHLACERGFYDCLQEILRPVHVSEMNYENTRFMYQEPDFELRNYEGQMCMHLAVLGRCKKSLLLLKSHGADSDPQDGKSGRTPVHYAVELQNLDLLKTLIYECGCDVNTRTFAGYTPIQFAYNLNRSLVEFLIHCGAEDIGLPSSDSESDSSSDEITKMDAEDMDLYFNGRPLACLPGLEVH